MTSKRVELRLKKGHLKTWRDFKSFVAAKYGQLWGFLTNELIAAIEEHMRLEGVEAYSSSKTVKDGGGRLILDARVKRRFHKIRMKLSEYSELPKGEILKIIEALGGVHGTRTIRQYFQLLEDAGIIRYRGGVTLPGKTDQIYTIETSRWKNER